MKYVFLDIKSLIIVIILVFLINLKPSQAQNETKEGFKEDALHLAGNEELINAAQTELSVASNYFLSQLRGVDRYQKQFAAMKKENSKKEVPNKRFSESNKKLQQLEVAKLKLDFIKRRIELLKQYRDHTEATQSDLAAYRDQLMVAQTAYNSLSTTYEKIDRYMSELNLRIKDKTLSARDLPNELRMQNRRNYVQMQKALEQKSKKAQKEQLAMAFRLMNISNEIINVESQFISLGNTYTNELQRKNIESELLSLDSSQFILKFNELKAEFNKLENVFSVSIQKFRSDEESVAALRKKLEGIKAPDADMTSLANTITRCEEAEQAIKAVEEIISYQNKQLENLKMLEPSDTLLLNNITVYEEEILVFMEQLFQMQLISGIFEQHIKDGKLTTDNFPNEYRVDSLIAFNEKLSDIQLMILTTKEQIEKELVQIKNRIRLLELSQRDMGKKLVYLKKVHNTISAELNKEENLKKISADDISDNFEDTDSDLETQQKELEKSRKEFQDNQITFNEVWQKFISMQDPLLQQVRENIADEKQLILNSLYLFADIEPSDEMNKASSKTAKRIQLSKNTEDAPEQEPLLVDIEDYQNLVSTKYDLIFQRDKYQTKLSEKSDSLDKNINKYISDLIMTYALAKQQKSIALALKFKISEKKFDEDDIPENYQQALSSEQLYVLENEVIKSFNEVLTAQLSVKQLLSDLQKNDIVLDSTEKQMLQIASFVGNKYDILKTYNVDKLEITGKPDDEKTEAEQKNFDQQAMRRLSNDDSMYEFMLQLLPTNQSENVVEQMKIHYIELIDLENRATNITKLKHKIEQLVKLSQDEYIAIEILIPLFKIHISQLESRYAEELAKGQIQLVPEKTEEILNIFEKENGYRFSIPAPIVDDKKIEFMEEIATKLFGLKADITAAKRELNIFEQRLTADINNEIIIYKNEVDDLTYVNADIQRRIRFITGRTSDDNELTSEEIPKNKIERLRFLHGELGLLRADRKALHQIEWVKLFFKLLFIIAFAMALNWLMKKIVGIAEKRAAKKRSLTSQKSLVYALWLTVSKVIIWLIAISVMLHSMGVNITAIFTGLGIGGLALAMASKEPIGNFLGGLTLLTYQPFKVGDFIKYPEDTCKVEHIALQYTKIRNQHTNSLIIVPNSKLADSEVVNVSESFAMGVRMQITIPLSIRNSQEKLELAKKLGAKVFSENVNAELIWVGINSFANTAFELFFFFQVAGATYPEFPDEVKGALNEAILQKFEENKIEYAVSQHLVIDKKETAKSTTNAIE